MEYLPNVSKLCKFVISSAHSAHLYSHRGQGSGGGVGRGKRVVAVVWCQEGYEKEAVIGVLLPDGCLY